MSNTSLPKKFTDRSNSHLNEAAKTTPCTVHIAYPALLRATTFFTEGLPRVSMQMCEGGQNVTLEFFVPDNTVARSAIQQERLND